MKTKPKRDELCRSYLGGSLMCWNKGGAITVSNNLQSNDVVDVTASKFLQFMYGALKLPIIRLLPLLD